MFVAEIMSSNLTVARSDHTLADLCEIFERVNYHHLPVVAALQPGESKPEKDKIVGILSGGDVSRHISPFVGTSVERDRDRALLRQTAADIMVSDVVTVDRGTSIDTASILLLENNISCLPVIDAEGYLEGLLSWKDILKFYVYSSD